MKHLAFPSIEQFRNVVKVVNDRTYHNGYVVKPTIRFRGHVKSHGTNAAIVFDTQENVFYAQSRSNVLSLTSDNAGFAQYFETNRNFFENWLKSIADLSDGERYISIYGEWCGGNIQKGVAIAGLPKMFLVFAIRTSNLDDDGKPDSSWYMTNIQCPSDHADIGCFPIQKFGQYEIDIDFNDPSAAQNQLVAWTEAVEAECPIGEWFWFGDRKNLTVELIDGKVSAEIEVPNELSIKCKEILVGLNDGNYASITLQLAK